MRFFTLLDFRLMVLVVCYGLISCILVYMAWGAYPSRRSAVSEETLKEQRGHELEGGHKLEDNPVAPFLVFVYLGVVVWVLLYGVVFGILGGPIW